MGKRHNQVFIAVVIAAMLLMSLQTRTGPLRPFWFASAGIDRANAAIAYMRDGLHVFWRVATLNEAELMELRMENMELRLAKHDYDRIHRENQRLRAAMDFKSRTPGAVAVARVVTRSGDRLSNVIVLDKGRRHGVKKNMIAIVPSGLVGKVISVEGGFSRLLLLDDSRFSAAVRLEDSRAEAVYKGRGNGNGVLNYLKVDIPVDSGVSVVTTGLDALFPPDIVLGTVDYVQTDSEELFHKVAIKPTVNLQTLEEVLIVTR